MLPFSGASATGSPASSDVKPSPMKLSASAAALKSDPGVKELRDRLDDAQRGRGREGLATDRRREAFHFGGRRR